MRKILIVSILFFGVWLGASDPTFAQVKGQPDEAKTKLVFQTPEEVFRAAQRAVAREDWRTFVCYATPELIDSLGRNGIDTCAFFIEPPVPVEPDREGVAELSRCIGKINDLSKKHKLPPEKLKALQKLAQAEAANQEKTEKRSREILDSLNDRTGFVAEYIATYQLFPIYSKHGRQDFKNAFVANTLLRLETNGDKATAYVIFPVTIDDEIYLDRGYIEFERVNGSWLISRFPDYFPHA